jgi:hypothetical protein
MFTLGCVFGAGVCAGYTLTQFTAEFVSGYCAAKRSNAAIEQSFVSSLQLTLSEFDAFCQRHGIADDESAKFFRQAFEA